MKTVSCAVKFYNGDWPMSCDGSIYANWDDHVFLPVPYDCDIIDEDRFYYVCSRDEFYKNKSGTKK